MKRILLIFSLFLLLFPFKCVPGDLGISWAAGGIWYWNFKTSVWTKTWSNVPSGPIAVGDVTGDGRADIISVWPTGLWYQDGATLGWVKVSPYIPSKLAVGDINGDGKVDIVGVFETEVQIEVQKFALSIIISFPEGGSVVGAGIYDGNTKVAVKATSSQDYTFTGWSDAASGTENPITVTMDSNKTISASFKKKEIFINTIPLEWGKAIPPIGVAPGSEVIYVGVVPEGTHQMMYIRLRGITQEVLADTTWIYPDGHTRNWSVRGDIVGDSIELYTSEIVPGSYFVKIKGIQSGGILVVAYLL